LREGNGAGEFLDVASQAGAACHACPAGSECPETDRAIIRKCAFGYWSNGIYLWCKTNFE